MPLTIALSGLTGAVRASLTKENPVPRRKFAGASLGEVSASRSSIRFSCFGSTYVPQLLEQDPVTAVHTTIPRLRAVDDA